MRYLVQTPWGTFRRVSTREYRFVVISCGSIEQTIVNRALSEKTELERRAGQYREGIRLGRIPAGAFQYDDVAKYPQYLAGIEQRLASWQAELDAKLALNAEKIRTQRGQREGWCGRRDLADKLAQQARRHGRANVHIYSCVVTGDLAIGQEVA